MLAQHKQVIGQITDQEGAIVEYKHPYLNHYFLPK